MKDYYREYWELLVSKVGKTSMRIKDTFPHVSLNGLYNAEPVGWWTAGFWPGLLWLVYSYSYNPQLTVYARSCEQQMDLQLENFYDLHHDVGFMWVLTSVANYKLTGNMESRKRALHAATILAGRFNINGRFIRAWTNDVFENSQGWAIIDCMMNISLLYWASEELNDPRFKHIAMAHTETVIREFIREDGSVHHIVCFDPDTGIRIGELDGQGYACGSAWSRGCAWAIYGLIIGYRYTNNKRYLNECKRVARFFVEHVEEDEAPLWDFDAPDSQMDGKDTSAAACAISGIFDLCTYLDGDERAYFEQANEKMMDTLLNKYVHLKDSDVEEAILSHGTVDYGDNEYVNTPIIYGDYFLAEALAKYSGNYVSFW